MGHSLFNYMIPFFERNVYSVSENNLHLFPSRYSSSLSLSKEVLVTTAATLPGRREER